MLLLLYSTWFHKIVDEEKSADIVGSFHREITHLSSHPQLKIDFLNHLQILI